MEEISYTVTLEHEVYWPNQGTIWEYVPFANYPKMKITGPVVTDMDIKHNRDFHVEITLKVPQFNPHNPSNVYYHNYVFEGDTYEGSEDINNYVMDNKYPLASAFFEGMEGGVATGLGQGIVDKLYKASVITHQGYRGLFSLNNIGKQGLLAGGLEFTGQLLTDGKIRPVAIASNVIFNNPITANGIGALFNYNYTDRKFALGSFNNVFEAAASGIVGDLAGNGVGLKWKGLAEGAWGKSQLVDRAMGDLFGGIAGKAVEISSSNYLQNTNTKQRGIGLNMDAIRGTK